MSSRLSTIVSEASRSSIDITRLDGSVGSGSPSSEDTLYRNSLKRVFDIVAVVGLSFVALPLITIFALALLLSGSLPFYGQARVGRGGRVFTMYKLRTMVHNAEAMLEEHLNSSPELRAEWERTQKLKNDPRITRFGQILRKTSLDELPQLYNVLIGNMSLVGPRPMLESQVALYPGSAYFRLRPGVTGFWQISDRNECDFADRARFDEAYDRELSLGTDLRVLTATVGVVLNGTGY